MKEMELNTRPRGVRNGCMMESFNIGIEKAKVGSDSSRGRNDAL